MPSGSGDINGDGKVDVADILLGQRIPMGSYTAPPAELQRGDVAPVIDGVPMADGLFTLGDLVVIQRFAPGVTMP